MKRISIVMAVLIGVQSYSSAFVVREGDFSCYKVIPFSYVSDTPVCEKNINISGLKDVEIEEIYTDNGKAKAYVSGSNLCIDLSDGEKSNKNSTIVKTNSVNISDRSLDNETGRIIKVKPNETIREVKNVSGDFESAKITGSGDIEIKVKESVKGIEGYDKSKIVKSTVNVSVDESNKSREITTEYINIPHRAIGNIKVVSGDASNVDGVYDYGDKIKVSFSGGNPKTNDTEVTSGYTYCWIDRFSDGKFKKHNPNSVYTTDRNKITGSGTYLKDKEEIGIDISNNNWLDYCGVIISGVKYMYPFDSSKGIPAGYDGIISEDGEIKIKEQFFNTEKYTINLSKAGVSYAPEGKLYSMGELVKGTSGWGETYPNHSWESNETFYNSKTGKYETYVKHFKFFYGPEIKKCFGGYFTYPYNCMLEYEHYKPTKLFSGEVVYTYETDEYVNGYAYNGWVKIKYLEKKTVNDYPPSAPYNVRYSAKDSLISWNAGSDDYTDEIELKYEIQIKKEGEDWKIETFTDKGKTSFSKNMAGSIFDIRVRTIDEENQASDWAYTDDSEIELSGTVFPGVVEPGDAISVYANTKSLSKIQKVEVKNDEMQMYAELQEVKESTPKFYEMSYDLEADFLEAGEYLYTDNSRVANNFTGKVNNNRFGTGVRTDSDTVKFFFVDDIELKKSGTLIFPGGNYINLPKNTIKINNIWWHLYFLSEIGYKNKVTGKKEAFIAFEDYMKKEKDSRGKAWYVPTCRLKINKFLYDDGGKPIYEYAEINKSTSANSVIIKWDTDVSNVTRFDVCLETKVIYSFYSKYDDVKKYVSCFDYYATQKYLKKYTLSSYGYIIPSKPKTVKWAKIVIGVAERKDLRPLTWLGYKVKKNEYVKQEYVDEYNANPEVRNTYRILFLDSFSNDMAIKKYLKLIKSDISMTADVGTVFGKDVLEINSDFEARKILVGNKVKPGKYELELTATDVNGKNAKELLTLIVKEPEKQVYPEVEEKEEDEKIIKTEIENIKLGRYFKKNNKGFLEELKKTKNKEEGFICAGETIGMYLAAKNAEYIDVDFYGDSSVKTLDKLSKRFLIEDPEKKGADKIKIEGSYRGFPKRIYPFKTDNETSFFKYFYVIPYGTRQSIESWATLRKGFLQEINKNKIFTAKTKPYGMKVTVNNDTEININFDVFERWDTVLNRDVSNYIVNSDSRWEMRLDK